MVAISVRRPHAIGYWRLQRLVVMLVAIGTLLLVSGGLAFAGGVAPPAGEELIISAPAGTESTKAIGITWYASGGLAIRSNTALVSRPTHLSQCLSGCALYPDQVHITSSRGYTSGGGVYWEAPMVDYQYPWEQNQGLSF